MSDHRTNGQERTPRPIPATHVHSLVTPLTVAKGRLQLVRCQLLHPEGSKIEAALRSLETAEWHIDHTARVIRTHAESDDGGAPSPE